MSLELYRKIGDTITKYHTRRFRKNQLLKDFQHDIYLSLIDKNPSDTLIRRVVYLYPWSGNHKYFKLNAEGKIREVSLFHEDGSSVEFEGSLTHIDGIKSFFTVVKKNIKVEMFDGEIKYFDSVQKCANYFKVCRSAVYKRMVVSNSGRYLNRKLSNIKSIMQEYLNHNPFNGSKLAVVKVIKRETYEKTKDKYENFKFDTDRGADFNEWYTLLVNEEGSGLLVKEPYEESKSVVFP